MALQRVKDLVGNELDDFAFFITGVTPGSINIKFDEVLPRMNALLMRKLCNVSLIAAAANRPNVIKYATKPDNADLSAFLTEHFYVQDHINFSALNLIGHMLLAGRLLSRQPFVTEFRKKMGGLSIWHVNLERSDLSELQKKILGEKVRRIRKEVALQPSYDLVMKLAARLRELDNPAVNVDLNQPPPNVGESAGGTDTQAQGETDKQGGSGGDNMDTDEPDKRTDQSKGKQVVGEGPSVIDVERIKKLEADIAAKLAEDKRLKELAKTAAETEKKRKMDEDKAKQMEIDVEKKRKEAADRELVERAEKESAKRRKVDTESSKVQKTAAAVIDPGGKTPIEDPGPTMSASVASHTTGKERLRKKEQEVISKKEGLRSSAIKPGAAPKKSDVNRYYLRKLTDKILCHKWKSSKEG